MHGPSVSIPHARLPFISEKKSQVAKLSQFRATVVLAEDVEIPCCRPDLDDCNRKVSENGQQPRGRASCGLGRAALINNDLREFPRRQQARNPKAVNLHRIVVAVRRGSPLQLQCLPGFEPAGGLPNSDLTWRSEMKTALSTLAILIISACGAFGGDSRLNMKRCEVETQRLDSPTAESRATSPATGDDSKSQDSRHEAGINFFRMPGSTGWMGICLVVAATLTVAVIWRRCRPYMVVGRCGRIVEQAEACFGAHPEKTQQAFRQAIKKLRPVQCALSFIHNSHPPAKRIFPSGMRFAQGLKAELICQNSMEPNHVRWNRRRTAGD